MSGVFDAYAAYYQLLYRDKPYAAEAAWVNACLTDPGAAAPRLLELGCGPGAHACEFAARGWDVVGVDLSPVMIANARERLRREPPPRPVEFHEGDARTLAGMELGRFDAVVALFHVVSYLTADADLLDCFRGVAGLLKPGGQFFFDFWHGPGVLNDPPGHRLRHMEGEGVSVTRTTTPTHFPDQHIVNVHFDVEVAHAGGSERFAEDHRMRYFYLPELADLLATAGLRLCEGRRWMADGQPDAADWYACVLAERLP